MPSVSMDHASQIIGPGQLNNIVRLQLAYMPPHTSRINVHRDMGGYALKAHRIHIPVLTNPKVFFEVSYQELICCVRLQWADRWLLYKITLSQPCLTLSQT